MIKNESARKNDLSLLWEQENTLNRLGGNNELLYRIARIFLDQINDKLDLFNSALAQCNMKEIQFISHSIKGTSGDVGAIALYHKASEIEQLAKLNKLSQLQLEAPALTHIAQETIKEMRAIMKQNPTQ